VKNITLIIVFAAFCVPTFAQNKEARKQKKAERQEKINQLIRQEEEGALIFNKQSAFGVKINTDGYGAFMEFGKLKTPVKTNFKRLEIGERKHPKEEKLTRGISGFAIGNPFIYGKINNFYFAKLGIGQQRLIGGKGNKSGVAISALYGGGFSAGLLKPYYLDISDPSSGERKDIKYDNNDSIFLSSSFINGASGFGKGFNEIKFVPGAYANAALRFDYGRYNELVSAIEVGLNVEYYTKEMPVILLNPNKKFFFNAYVSVVFGKRR
jgi:hypothetical protein